MRMFFGCLPLLLSLALPQTAYAGMGAVFPKYHPAPCEGGACKGDDPHSGMPCQGLLCTFSSAKSLQPPVTGSQAAAPAAPAPVPEAATQTETPAVADAKPKKRKISAKRSKTREAKADRTTPSTPPAKADPAPAR